MRRRDISAVIRSKRHENGISQSELADMAGCSTSTIKAIETNRMQGSPKMLAKIAKVFKCDVLELIYGGNEQ